jgi:tetrahydromethanopterin S-methyltransferase subunit E
MLDMVKGTLRSAIGAAEHVESDVEARSPAAVEAKLDEMIAVMHRTCESAERHVEVVEALAQSLVPLTDSVSKLTDQINLLLQVTAPLAAAERDMSRVEGIFHRRRRPQDADGGGGPES